MNSKQAYFLLLRYLILIIIGFLKLSILYNLFTPLTVYPVFYALSLFYPQLHLLSNNVLSLNNIFAQIIPACVAGAAYYLLLILNLTTPMKVKTRVKSLIFLLTTFLLFNILRIVLFFFILTKGFQYFSVTHLFMWYFGSTFFVVLLWFINIKLFSIRVIPIYTDVKNIYKELK